MRKSTRQCRSRRLHVLLGVLVVLVTGAVCRRPLGRLAWAVLVRARGQATVGDCLEEYGVAARARLAPHLAAAGVPHPPARVTLVAFKDEKIMEVWARGDTGGFRQVRSYPILGTSGRLGPKLEEGDGQVPEGVYRIDFLNPNSRFHLSLRLDYPNDFDRRHAREDGRRYPGSDIMIHGGHASIGCLAMGDEAIEDLFVLVADTGVSQVRVIIAPVDFRSRELPSLVSHPPPWADELYRQIAAELDGLGE